MAKIKTTNGIELLTDSSVVAPDEHMFVDYESGEAYKAVSVDAEERTPVSSQEFNEFFYS